MILFVLSFSLWWFAYLYFQVWTLSQTVLLFFGLCWDIVGMCICLPSEKPDEIQQLALSFLLTQSVTVCQVMSFLGKANFCASHLLFRVTFWMFITLQLTYFLPFSFQILLCVTVRDRLSRSRVQVPCNSLFLMFFIARDATLLIGPSLFRVLGYLCPWVATGAAVFAGIILLYRIFKLLHKCCVDWLFIYQARWQIIAR